MPNIKISQLPYVGKTGYTSNDIVPFVSYINPTGDTSETKIDDLKDYVLDNSFVQNIIKVGKGGNIHFTSLYDAIESITGSSSTNRFVIEVGPGIYVEPPIDVSNKPYVSIVGSDINSVVILPNNPSNTIVKLGNMGHISFLTISGATSGVGILCEDLDGFAIAHKISMYDNDIQINVVSTIANTQFYGEYIDLNGLYTYGVYVKSNNPTYTALTSLENHFNFPTGSATIANFCQGSGSQLTFNGGDCVGINTPGSIAFRSEDYANLLISSVGIRGWDIGIDFPNIGGPCYFDIDGATIFNSNSYDLKVDNTLTVGTIQGSLGQQYISNNSESVYWDFLDNTNGELEITRKLSVTFKEGTHTDLSTLLFEGNTMGVLEGGVITIVSGLTFSISEGYGYLESIANNSVIKRYDWLDTQHTLLPNQNQYIYINNNGILSNSGTRPNSIYNIVLGRVVTNSTDIIIIDSSPLNASHTSNLYGNLFRNALGPIYDSGSIVTENVTPYHLDVTSGDYYYSTNEYLPSGGTDITFTMYYGDGTTGWTTSATTEVVNGWDDGSGTIAPLTLSAFTKHTLYVVGEGVNEQYFLVLGQTQYPTLIQTEDALLPIPPPYFDDSVTQIASIYIQQGSVNIIGIEDIRPVIGFKAGGVNASSLHGNLLGLNADDHTQYLLVDGSRAMEGDINMGGNDIYSANTVTTNTISATTYSNLPVDPDTYVTGFTYGSNVFTIKQNNGQSDLTAVINSVTGWTVNGNLTVTGTTSVQGLTATTISATTYSNLPVDPDTYTTGYTYSNNTFTIKQNNGQPNLTTTIDSVTGMTVNGNLTVTGNTSINAVTATTINSGTVTVTNTSGTPSQAASFDSTGKLVAGLGQTTFTAFGSATLSVTSAVTTFTVLPGVTQTITVPENCKLLITANGGMNTTSTTTTSIAVVDIAIFIDGAYPTNGGYIKIGAHNPSSTAVNNTGLPWSITTIQNLSAGSHTIDVRAVYSNGSTSSVSGSNTTARQGGLYITIIKN